MTGKSGGAFQGAPRVRSQGEKMVIVKLPSRETSASKMGKMMGEGVGIGIVAGVLATHSNQRCLLPLNVPPGLTVSPGYTKRCQGRADDGGQYSGEGPGFHSLSCPPRSYLLNCYCKTLACRVDCCDLLRI